MNDVERALERSREDLDAARHLAEAGFLSQAASRSYYAAFQAAEAALLSLGETRSEHSGLVKAFGQLVVRPGGFDERSAGVLRALFEQRNQPDGGAPRSPEDAEGMIRDAETFSKAVERWLGAR